MEPRLSTSRTGREMRLVLNHKTEPPGVYSDHSHVWPMRFGMGQDASSSSSSGGRCCGRTIDIQISNGPGLNGHRLLAHHPDFQVTDTSEPSSGSLHAKSHKAEVLSQVGTESQTMVDGLPLFEARANQLGPSSLGLHLSNRPAHPPSNQ